MSRRPQRQVSFFDPEFADPGCLEHGTLPWLLAKHRSLLFPPWLFVDWKPASRRGPKGWDGPLLMTLLLLRWSESGMSRAAAVRRARRDTSWRAALGLQIGGETPSLRTLRRFEAFLQRRHGQTGVSHTLLFQEHFVRLCIDRGVVDARAVWAMDSTPMWAYGAMLDTIRLLGDGVRMLSWRWARLTGTTMEALAVEWSLPLLAARSTKAAYRVDWRDLEQKTQAVDRIASDVLAVVERIREQLGAVRRGKRKGLRRPCRNLLKVISDDLETDEHGRLVVARGTLSCVPAHRLIHRARDLCGKIERVLADTAYGGARLRRVVAGAEHVELLSPPPPVADRPGRIGRADMDINLDAGTATCPAGSTVQMRWSWSELDGVHVRRAAWPKETCSVCPRASSCVAPKRAARGWGRIVKLHAYERELVSAREAWESPTVRDDYRVRSQCERLVNQVVRHGGRKAGAWGLAAARVSGIGVAVFSGTRTRRSPERRGRPQQRRAEHGERVPPGANSRVGRGASPNRHQRWRPHPTGGHQQEHEPGNAQPPGHSGKGNPRQHLRGAKRPALLEPRAPHDIAVLVVAGARVRAGEGQPVEQVLVALEDRLDARVRDRREARRRELDPQA